MDDLVKMGRELEEALHLPTKIIAYRKFERAEDLEKIKGVKSINRPLTFCQIPALVRVYGWTIGVTRDDQIKARCKNFCGLNEATEESIWVEAAVMALYNKIELEDGLTQSKKEIITNVVLAAFNKLDFQ